MAQGFLRPISTLREALWAFAPGKEGPFPLDGCGAFAGVVKIESSEGNAQAGSQHTKIILFASAGGCAVVFSFVLASVDGVGCPRAGLFFWTQGDADGDKRAQEGHGYESGGHVYAIGDGGARAPPRRRAGRPLWPGKMLRFNFLLVERFEAAEPDLGAVWAENADVGPGLRLKYHDPLQTFARRFAPVRVASVKD